MGRCSNATVSTRLFLFCIVGALLQPIPAALAFPSKRRLGGFVQQDIQVVEPSSRHPADKNNLGDVIARRNGLSQRKGTSVMRNDSWNNALRYGITIHDNNHSNDDHREQHQRLVPLQTAPSTTRTRTTTSETTEIEQRRTTGAATWVVQVLVRAERYPEEIFWRVGSAETDTELAAGVATSTSSDPNPDGISLFLSEGWYWFQLTDSRGEGICCQHGHGFYRVVLNQENMLIGDGGDDFQYNTGKIYFEVTAPSTSSSALSEIASPSTSGPSPSSSQTQSPATATTTTASVASPPSPLPSSLFPSQSPSREEHEEEVVTLPILTVGFSLSPSSLALSDDESDLMRQLLAKYVRDMLTRRSINSRDENDTKNPIIVDLSSDVSLRISDRTGIVVITGTWVGPLNDGPTVDTMVQSFAFWGIMDMYRILEEEMGLNVSSLTVQVNGLAVQPVETTNISANRGDDDDDRSEYLVVALIIFGLAGVTAAVSIMFFLTRRSLHGKEETTQQGHDPSQAIASSFRKESTTRSSFLAESNTTINSLSKDSSRSSTCEENHEMNDDNGRNDEHAFQSPDPAARSTPPYGTRPSEFVVSTSFSTPVSLLGDPSLVGENSSFDLDSVLSRPSCIEVSLVSDTDKEGTEGEDNDNDEEPPTNPKEKRKKKAYQSNYEQPPSLLGKVQVENEEDDAMVPDDQALPSLRRAVETTRPLPNMKQSTPRTPYPLRKV